MNNIFISLNEDQAKILRDTVEHSITIGEEYLLHCKVSSEYEQHSVKTKQRISELTEVLNQIDRKAKAEK